MTQLPRRGAFSITPIKQLTRDEIRLAKRTLRLYLCNVVDNHEPVSFEEGYRMIYNLTVQKCGEDVHAILKRFIGVIARRGTPDKMQLFSAIADWHQKKWLVKNRPEEDVGALYEAARTRWAAILISRFFVRWWYRPNGGFVRASSRQWCGEDDESRDKKKQRRT